MNKDNLALGSTPVSKDGVGSSIGVGDRVTVNAGATWGGLDPNIAGSAIGTGVTNNTDGYLVMRVSTERNEFGIGDGTTLTGWVAIESVTLIEKADGTEVNVDTDVKGAEDAQTAPEGEPTTSKNKTKHHYIFFDAFNFAFRRDKGHAYENLIEPFDLEVALAIQHGVNSLVNPQTNSRMTFGEALKALFNEVTRLGPKEEQDEIEKTIHLVPLKDIAASDCGDGCEAYLDRIVNHGLQGTLTSFKTFWDKEISSENLPDNKEIGYIGFWLHGSNLRIKLYDGGEDRITKDNYKTYLSDIPPMDAFFFISCNVGDRKIRHNSISLAQTLSEDVNITKGVIASDGELYSSYIGNIEDGAHWNDTFDLRSDRTRRSTYRNMGFTYYKAGELDSTPHSQAMVRSLVEYDDNGVTKYRKAENQGNIYKSTSHTLKAAK